MSKQEVVTTMEASPPTEFWTDDLEFDHQRAERAVADGNALHDWIDGLRGQQVRVLCFLLGLGHEESIQKLRPLIHKRADDVRCFVPVQHFGRGKSEVAIVEVAREVLSPHVIDMCLRRKRNAKGPGGDGEPADEHFDRAGLLFALYRRDRVLLRKVFHFNKVHRTGFASLVLAKAPKRRPQATLVDFLSVSTVRKAVGPYQHEHGGGLEVHAVWVKEGRPYVFLRRPMRPGHIQVKSSTVHGDVTEWIILDFSPDADQVNIASRSLDESRMVAQEILGAYYGRECELVNEERLTDSESVEGFIAAARAGTDGVGLLEVCAGNTPLRGASQMRISNEDPKSLAESLDHFESSIGSVLENPADLEWITVLYCGKRVGLYFDHNESGEQQYEVRYTDKRLNGFERRQFEQKMRSKYGIGILSTEKR